jgi:hypothetical protein
VNQTLQQATIKQHKQKSTTQIDDDGIGATGGNSGQNPPKNP